MIYITHFSRHNYTNITVSTMGDVPVALRRCGTLRHIAAYCGMMRHIAAKTTQHAARRKI